MNGLTTDVMDRQVSGELDHWLCRNRDEWTGGCVNRWDVNTGTMDERIRICQ